jgi:predicted metal-dependent hydrolase
MMLSLRQYKLTGVDHVGTGYTLIRSGRRTLSLEVTREQTVLVRAPWRCPQREIDSFVSGHGDWIRDKLAQQKKREEARPEPTEEERRALIARAKAELPGRVAFFGGMMGLTPAGITVTGAAKRFGSCSPKNRLCFSWRLMRYPAEAVDYVVVHELAHLVHRNHGKAFHALVASVLPDWKERKKLLRE